MGLSGGEASGVRSPRPLRAKYRRSFCSGLIAAAALAGVHEPS
jgi:hypothetical protein